MERTSIRILDRESKQFFTEKVIGASMLNFLYTHPVGSVFCDLLSRNAWVSSLYGWVQKRAWTKKKIQGFVKKYRIDVSEFLDPIESYHSFNDFFIRKLKPTVRPIADSDVIIPADGRYYFYQDISSVDGFIVKGKRFDLSQLLQDEHLAEDYAQGSMVIARLCPVDYHRFHFPIECFPSESRLINGFLYSVNPVAVRKNLNVFVENKRMTTLLTSDLFGTVTFIEVGATNVGSIHQTYEPLTSVNKGEEKGYFSFGGSSLIILFEKNRVTFDDDLIEATKNDSEVFCKMGQSMGKRPTG